MDRSVLDHLFLPCDLPSSSADDCLTQNEHVDEHMLLDYIKTFLNSPECADMQMTLPVIRTLADCVERWSILQNPRTLTVLKIQSVIEQLPPGSFLPLYFHAQNAAILIEVEEENIHQALISSWQVLLPSANISSSAVPHLSCFPVASYRLHDRSGLSGQAHCELLMDFMNNTIEYSTSQKASRTVPEIRDVPQSHYVCQWWIQKFSQLETESNFNSSVQFKKKHRDQIRWNNTLLPFRRSGLWMTIKVTLQTILTKRLGAMGSIIYKLLITQFLVHHIYARQRSDNNTIPIHLLIHCLRKVVRRLNKIEGLPAPNETNSLRNLIENIKQDIEIKIDQILPKFDWQKAVQIDEERNESLSKEKSELNHHDIYQHSCQDFKNYLNDLNCIAKSRYSLGPTKYADLDIVNQVEYIPSTELLTKKFHYTIGIALIRIELWVESSLEQWFNRPATLHNERNRFEALFDFFEDYQLSAMNHYYSKEGPSDPFGYSRFILTSSTIVRSMHEKLCADPRFQRLKFHSIAIWNLLELFEFLILPNREDMMRARNLYRYFSSFKQQSYPDLLVDITSGDAFGVHYADRSSTMKDSIQRIRNQAEQDKQYKIREVTDAKEKYTRLMNSVNGHSCTCSYTYHYPNKCNKCTIQEEANRIKVQLFECPIPVHYESALAVVFELQMPIEIRTYRDILWQLTNRPDPFPKHEMYVWLTIPPHLNKLGQFNTNLTNCAVKLVSPTKSVTQTHYSYPPSISSAPISAFLHENSLKVQISPTETSTFENERRILTPQLVHADYKTLQFTIDTTNFVQNDVIAKLSECSARLKPTQFVEFGSFRSGHRLQWWNLLIMLEMDSLSIAQESVAILIIHSLLQYGPLTADTSAASNTWCPESHQPLLEDHFVDEVILRLDRRLDDCELNWQNELVLVVITMITMRLLTLCNSTKEERAVQLAMKCRRIGEKWVDLISKSIHTVLPSCFNEVEELRLKMVTVGFTCLLTFSAQSEQIKYLLSSTEHILSLLKAVTTMHDNIILNKTQSTRSIFLRNLMRYSERVAVTVQPMLTNLLQKTSYQSLNEFAASYWAVIKSKGTMNGKWAKRRKDVYDGWYDSQFESRQISIDCIRGTFLVDGMTIGFLPETITSNDLFDRVFDGHVFEVQAAELPNTYITKNLYHDGRVLYEFYMDNNTNSLIVTERDVRTQDSLQLIPHTCFTTELPDAFVTQHSHWWNIKNQRLEFRPVLFQSSNFLDDKPYILALDTGFITTTTSGNAQLLVDQSSSFFHHLFIRYFIRLDEKPYVYMLRDHGSAPDIIIHIHLSRLGIAFRYSGETGNIGSREYSDMSIAGNQWFGTLTGLKSGLLLSPSLSNSDALGQYPYRKLIVPFGQIEVTNTRHPEHQEVAVKRSPSMNFPRSYFVFILNDRLRILQSTNSPTGWLYLALLHAMTSHSLCDQYTEMTGMERAFQLLNSAGCWSDQPYDALSSNILGQIAAISPKVNYYPTHLKCMVKIDWNDPGLPPSLQHFGYYLIAKNLMGGSQQFTFMYPLLVSPQESKLFDEKLYDETLMKKLYWDYRDSYNPLARLSTELEADILSTRSGKPYCSAAEYCSHIENYGAVRLVDDLYSGGDVYLRDCSKQPLLPLSQWMSGDNELKHTWVGLFKVAVDLRLRVAEQSAEGTERFEMLLDFLHYISDKCKINPYYLQILKTVMELPAESLTSLRIPPFIHHKRIEDSSFTAERINLHRNYTSREVKKILEQATYYWYQNRTFPENDGLLIYGESYHINSLFESWRSNEELRSFLEAAQRLMFSVPIKQFDTKIVYHLQEFARELIEDHHQIQFKPTQKSIDPILLQDAKRKFHRHYTGHFNKPTTTLPTITYPKEFPCGIFPSVEDPENPLKKITNYFRNQLEDSWKKLLLNKFVRKGNPSIDEVTTLLHSFREQSTKFWNELVQSIVFSNERLFQTGLATRITPGTVISCLLPSCQTYFPFTLTTDQCSLLGGAIVNWTSEQQLERTLHFASHKNWEDFRKEISHTSHSNWIPSKHIPWLILELEMNITIREIQIKVARHMMQPHLPADDSTVQSIVMQMNMGEGKTSVILPMLAVGLCSTASSLVRIIVLKSLFPTNYQSLRYKLGGLLNRRIFPFACRRDMNWNEERIEQIFTRLTRGLSHCDVVLTSPEDVLSFDLLSIDKCRRHEFKISRLMLSIRQWLKVYARDVLDESDEILHVKYQLVYTVGEQQQVDGGAERWKTIQSVMELVKKHAENIASQFSEGVCYKKADRKSGFPQFRLQSLQPFPSLCEKIANDWLDPKSHRESDKQLILSFILNIDMSIDGLLDKFSVNDLQLFLILRGLLSSEVLFVSLKKRYRVNYGINLASFYNRLMAVPFRAKDVAADQTEFGHADVALVLTHLTYYYSGLNDYQMTQCFDRLVEEEMEPESIYDNWIFYEESDDIPASIRRWQGVNLKDYQQRTHYLFPTLRYNVLVVNYFLNHFVFPREAKQFPCKLVSSAWDLSSSERSKIITGFSGTNDTQLLLPVHIRQHDLPELQKTDAIVVNNLLQPENERYEYLPMNATSGDILNQITNYRDMINVILDVGAVFIDGSNEEIARIWLDLSDQAKIDYAVYFNSDSIVVCDRQLRVHPFVTSPASERLDHCIFYLDEIHTRGTDFKFPSGFRAVLTLGNGLTKDRFVQAAMRMRKLGIGHSLTFCSSHEVHQQILALKRQPSEGNLQHQINVVDILRWVYENTQQATWDGFHHWAAQSLSFQRKLSAFRNIQWKNEQQVLTDTMMIEMAAECLESEIIDLRDMYGSSKVLRTVFEIHSVRYQHIDYHLSAEIRDTVLRRLRDFGGTKQRLSQLLDEEQQRELEQELEEERQLARPGPAEPCAPVLHDEIKRLCNTQNEAMNLTQLPNVFRGLAYAFIGTTLFPDCQVERWGSDLWISTEFQRVIKTKGESLNPFLRPPRWMIIYRNQFLIFVSPFEANWLIGRLSSLHQQRLSKKRPITTLRILLPRTRRIQSIFVNTPTLTVPSSIGLPNSIATFTVSLEQLAQLFIFNGTIYFETIEEQAAFCQCLGLCPKPRTSKQEEAFQNGYITIDGFVSSPILRHRLQLVRARFNANPLHFVKLVIENRNNVHATITSHVGSIILNSFKLI